MVAAGAKLTSLFNVKDMKADFMIDSNEVNVQAEVRVLVFVFILGGDRVKLINDPPFLL